MIAADCAGRTHGRCRRSPATAADIGLREDQIHEVRQIRVAEVVIGGKYQGAVGSRLQIKARAKRQLVEADISRLQTATLKRPPPCPARQTVSDENGFVAGMSTEPGRARKHIREAPSSSMPRQPSRAL